MNAYKSPSIHRTPLYRAKAAYYGMLKRCLNKDGKNPSYANVELKMTWEEWLQWAVPEYEKFQRDNPGVTPNAARIGDAGHYELGNIRIISQTQNCEEQAGKYINAVQENGTKRCSSCKTPRPVEMFSKNKSRWDGLASDCKDCVNKYIKQMREKKEPIESGKKEIPHGTYSGYKAETYRKMQHCDECKKANAEYLKEKRKKG